MNSCERVVHFWGSTWKPLKLDIIKKPINTLYLIRFSRKRRHPTDTLPFAPVRVRLTHSNRLSQSDAENVWFSYRFRNLSSPKPESKTKNVKNCTPCAQRLQILNYVDWPENNYNSRHLVWNLSPPSKCTCSAERHGDPKCHAHIWKGV